MNPPPNLPQLPPVPEGFDRWEYRDSGSKWANGRTCVYTWYDAGAESWEVQSSPRVPYGSYSHYFEAVRDAGALDYPVGDDYETRRLDDYETTDEEMPDAGKSPLDLLRRARSVPPNDTVPNKAATPRTDEINSSDGFTTLEARYDAMHDLAEALEAENQALKLASPAGSKNEPS